MNSTGMTVLLMPRLRGIGIAAAGDGNDRGTREPSGSRSGGRSRWPRREGDPPEADELGPHGINVTVVHPGATLTESLAALTAEDPRRFAAFTGTVSIGRIVTADEVAAVVTFLASSVSVAINGEVIAAGGGTRGAIHY
ncbi:SDR family oxidoreductase [Frankia sp. Cppng1_Ct_nod]|uniref:SDR family oxidoreductase n=1 Tax=Frankia sp. Cppng1_Ct_nod TaxID=2897162 RepID=UPI001F5FB433|nr:SDR family oxidoreductase [Frankia sp. Cppng1_Ct_nod]